MINLYDILEAADGQLFGEPGAQIFTDFCFDSRRVQKGELFVALKTEHGDGHHYMADAVAGGATGIMCHEPPNFDTEGLTVIVMRSVENALMRWTRVVLGKYGTTVIGVAGSMGTSVTKEAIAHVLNTRYTVYRSPAESGGRFGLPLALGRLTKDHQIAVLEFSIEQVGEMAALVDAASPMVGVVTNVGHGHINRFGSLEALAQEKAELVRRLPADGLAVLNFDDPLARQMTSETLASVMTVGLDIAQPQFGSDLLAYNILVDRYKTGFDLRYGKERFIGRWVPLLGAHHLYAALTALAVGISYNIPLEDGLQALTGLELLPGRMRPLDGPEGSLLIDDSFDATPEDMQAVLDWLEAVRTNGRMVLVAGDIDGLGNYATTAHRQVGERAAHVVDHFITKGDLVAEAGRVALDSGMPRSQVQITFSAEDAALAVRQGLGPKDVVVIKGSASARMERVVQRLLADEKQATLLVRQAAMYDQPEGDQSYSPSWVQIDMEAVAYNTRRLKTIIGPDVTLMAVVKANAYGHGAIPVSATALNNGAEYLGVGSIHEAVELREAGIAAPILVMGYTPPWAARQVIRHDLTITLYDSEIARAFERAAHEMNVTIRAHVKVDSGMGRLGLLPDEVTHFFRSLRNLNHLEIEGIFTQFATAHSDHDYTRLQIKTFERVVDPLLAAGFRFRYIHAANSAATIHLPESRFNMVRCGIALHGLNPSLLTPLPADFRPAMTWKTTIAQVRRLPPGSYVGYDNTYRVQTTEHIAIIPVGYANGFRYGPQRWKHVLVRGEFAPLVGQVSMDQAAISVTRIEGVQIGDEVVLLGQQGSQQITVEDVAEYLDTTPYEVVSTILARPARVK